MDDERNIKLYSIMMDCPDPYKLAQFYAKLLKWDIPFHDEDWACVGAPGAAQGSYPGISFQRNPEYQPPVWPGAPGAQQQMAHLDFAVKDLEKAVQYAVHCGAAVAQPWRRSSFQTAGRSCWTPRGTPSACVK